MLHSVEKPVVSLTDCRRWLPLFVESLHVDIWLNEQGPFLILPGGEEKLLSKKERIPIESNRNPLKDFFNAG